MSPKLNLLPLYAAGRFFLDADADPTVSSREFCARVFGEEHAILGELLEAFESWRAGGITPRRQWSNEELVRVFGEIIERLERRGR